MLNELRLFMRMLQNCNGKNYLLICIFALMTGCVTQNPAIEGKPVDTNVPPVATPTPAPVTGDTNTKPATVSSASTVDANSTPAATTPEGLSTTTVAPEGFDKFLGIFTPYRMTIQQGNFVSKEMADQVKLGMTREQVRFLLGTALITDMFHADRWDYVFRLLKPSGELTTSRVTVYFERSLVARMERGDLPNEQEYLTRITNAAIVDSIEHVDVKAKAKSKKDE
jgi:outer membrane protein assembly factor BamE